MHDKLEIRSYGGDAAPRLDGRTIDGYAIVFNQRSEVCLTGRLKMVIASS